MFVEREALLASLDANLDEAAGGNGRLVFVGGEAGVGKTALTGEFARQVRDVRGMRVLRGTVDSPSAAAPLGPFLEAMADDMTALEDLLGIRSRLFPAVRAALATTPTLLVLEDLHWADQATLDLIGYLGRRLDGTPALILGTFRDDEVGGSHPLRIVLADLAPRAGVARMHVPRLTRAAVGRLAVDAGSSIDVDALYHRTAGNSFFVTEVLATDADNLPQSVRDATLARAARLSAAGRRVLDAAAVIGVGIELDLLRHVSGQPSEAIDECFERGLLTSSGTRLEFRHELAREAVEQAIPAAARAELHAATLARLRATGVVDDRRLARHAEAFGDAAAVVTYARKAGDRAARFGARREAAQHYRTALRYAHLLGRADHAALLEQLSYECYLTDQLQAAVDAQAEALELRRRGGDAVRIGAALRWLSRLSWFLGRGADSERFALESLATLESLEPGAELAMAYSNLAQLRMLAGNTDGAVQWGNRAIELARGLGNREVESHALNNVGTALTIAGQHAEGGALLGRSLDIALALDAQEHAARAYTNLGTLAVDGRRFAESDRYLRAGVAYSQERDLDAWRLYMDAALARSLAEQGRLDAARQLAGEVLRRPQLSPVSRIPALVGAARVATRRGEAGVDAMLDEALTLAEATGENQRLVPVIIARVEAAWTAGRSVVDDLDRADRLGIDNPWDAGELTWWAQRAGEDRALPGPPAAPFALMLAGRPTEAAASWADVGSPLWRAFALTESDDPDDVRTGVEVLRSIGAEATVRAVLRDLHAQGKPVPRGPRATSRANPGGLTVRELEVLTLLTEGMSNADIAAALYLSQKTAGHHVSAVLRKLDEPTRSRAVAAARRLGIVPT